VFPSVFKTKPYKGHFCKRFVSVIPLSNNFRSSCVGSEHNRLQLASTAGISFSKVLIAYMYYTSSILLLFQPLLRVLCEHTSNDVEKRYLDFLVSRQGSEVYIERGRGSNLCLLDILMTFPSCNPPIERVIEQLPRLQPRPYSVASYDPGNLY